MLEELFKKGYLDIEKMLLDYAKFIGLNSEEAFIMQQILKNYAKTNTLSIDDIQSQVLISSSKLDKIVASLMERGFYEVYLSYDNGKGTECISFRPLFDRFEKLLKDQALFDPYDIEKANQYISTKMNRVLTAQELEILQSFMVDDHYTFDQIAAVVDEIVTSKKTLNMRNITTGLANKRYEIQPKKEAPKVFQDFLKRI